MYPILDFELVLVDSWAILDNVILNMFFKFSKTAHSKYKSNCLIHLWKQNSTKLSAMLFMLYIKWFAIWNASLGH